MTNLREMRDSRVLIIEHNSIVRDELSHLVEKFGMKVLVAESFYVGCRLLNRFEINTVIIGKMGPWEEEELAGPLCSNGKIIPVVFLKDVKPPHKPGFLNPAFTRSFRDSILRALYSVPAPRDKETAKKHERVGMFHRAHWEFSGFDQGLPGQILNLSHSGAYISSTGFLPKEGDVIEFEFKTDEQGLHQIRAVGIVRWAHNAEDRPEVSGFGLEFALVEESSRLVIESLCKSRPPYKGRQNEDDEITELTRVA